ncbi:hypothetical protein [Candidatus Avelusimicrobium stercoris]|uniref:hypothetical protein n=1 Tax=Candidatus Avelusimicrobium stercoris TaxID=1947924 RepID=UPI003D1197AF
MNNLGETLEIFDKEYLEESRPILERYLGGSLTLAEVEEFVAELLNLEVLVRSLRKVSQD